MTNRLKWVLQAGAVALVAACGGTSGDDVVIRTDVESAGNSATTVATQADPRIQATATTADVKNERDGR